MIHIEELTQSNTRLNCEPGILRELSDVYTFKVPNAQFHPKVKAGMWDGYIRLVNMRNSTIPKGLVPDVIKFAKNRDYEVKIDPDFVAPFKEQIDYDLKEFALPFEPRDYQSGAVNRCLEKKRQIIISSTGSGKSLIIYLIMMVLLAEKLDEDKKILLVVPNISLVHQMYDDFQKYSADEDFDVEPLVHKIFGGQDKNTAKPIVVSTWQSIYKEKPAYFKQFGAVLGDEVHLFEAKACSDIMNKSVNAFYRFGFTGTLKDSKTHELALKGSFGPVFTATETDNLMQKGVLADLSIKAILIKHDEEEIQNLKAKAKPDKNGKRKLTYRDEIEHIVEHEGRNKFISKLAKSRKGNTLVLYQFVEKQGEPLHDMISEMCPDKKVYIVHGGISGDERELIRKDAEESDNVIIVASYGTYQVGINIVNLHNIIFASPTKAKIRLLQSIGRGLRRGKDKTSVTLFDIADDFRGHRKTKNYTLKHFLTRVDLYQQENFKTKITKVTI